MSGGFIDHTFKSQYYVGLLPSQIRIPATDGSRADVKLQRSQLTDASQRTHKGRSEGPAHIAASGDGQGGLANDGSDSDDAGGWPTEWNMFEHAPEDYAPTQGANTQNARVGSSAASVQQFPVQRNPGYLDDPDHTWPTTAVAAVQRMNGSPQHMHGWVGQKMGLTPAQHHWGLQRCAGEEKASDSNDSNGLPPLERSGSDSDENDATGNEQSGFRDDDQTLFDQSGGVGSHNTRNCPTC